MILYSDIIQVNVKDKGGTSFAGGIKAGFMKKESGFSALRLFQNVSFGKTSSACSATLDLREKAVLRPLFRKLVPSQTKVCAPAGFWNRRILEKCILVVLLVAVGSGLLCGQEAARQTPDAAETAARARPELAHIIIDVNPLMWILSGMPDEINNRSIFFDVGFQFNILPDAAVRINPAFTFGFTGETAFSDSPIQFFEIDVPLSLFCFPFPHDTYLDVLFFGISVVAAYHKTMGTDADTIFFSVGALLEAGYQIKLSNHLAITPSIGVSRMFPKLIDGEAYTPPSFHLYSPWTADSPVAPRARITLGFWI
jgi:hypothetical protein